MKAIVAGKCLLVRRPGRVTQRGLQALVSHARSGGGWGGDDEAALEREVEAACKWIDAALSARMPIKGWGRSAK